MGADLATQGHKHCTGVPTEGREDGKQDVTTLCCRISCCSDKDYIIICYNSSNATSLLNEQYLLLVGSYVHLLYIY